MIEIKNELFLDRWAPLGSTAVGVRPAPKRGPLTISTPFVVWHQFIIEGIRVPIANGTAVESSTGDASNSASSASLEGHSHTQFLFACQFFFRYIASCGATNLHSMTRGYSFMPGGVFDHILARLRASYCARFPFFRGWVRIVSSFSGTSPGSTVCFCSFLAWRRARTTTLWIFVHYNTSNAADLQYQNEDIVEAY